MTLLRGAKGTGPPWWLGHRPLRGPMLLPGIAVLRRSGGGVQVGADPRWAVVLAVPGLAAESIVEFLQLLDGLHSREQVAWRAREYGLGPGQVEGIVEVLAAAQVLWCPGESAARIRRVQVHGLGPLAEALVRGARRLGLEVQRTKPGNRGQVRTESQPDVVVLTDALIPDPEFVARLHERRTAHLVVRICDGAGVVGPLVLPGQSSCLRCADLRRAAADQEWPHIAAQLLGRVGCASPAGIAATAAVALRELETIQAGRREQPPATLNATVHLDPSSHRMVRRRQDPHPDCVCRAAGMSGEA